MRRVAFLYNPASNRGRSVTRFARLKDLTADWQGVCYRESGRAGDLRGLADSLSGQYDVVAACGGDGTVHEVAGALAGKACALGVVPIGNGNDTAKSLGVPVDLPAAVELLREGDLRQVDLGSCNGRYFVNTLGFGFDGQVARMVREQGGGGRVAYVAAALRTCFLHRRISCEIDGEPASRILLTFANGRVEGGSFRIAPGAYMDDGKLEMVEAGPVPRLLLPLLLPLFTAGRQEWLPMVRTRSVEACRLRFGGPVSVHMDGEGFGEEASEFHINVHPGALKAVCGPGAALEDVGRAGRLSDS